MATLSRLKPGQTLYTITKQKMGNTTIRINVMHHVIVKEVFPDEGYCIASWNGNTPRRYSAFQVKSWRVNKPKPKTQIRGMNSY